MEKKKIILSTIPNIVFIFVLVFVKSLLTNINTTLGYILYIFSMVSIYNIIMNKPYKIKDAILTIVYISVFIVLFKYSGIFFGAFGVLLLIIFISLFKVYKKREMYFTGMRDIETKIFGKPLDKELWKEENKK